MGFFDDGISIISSKGHHSKHLKLKRRSRSRSRGGEHEHEHGHRHHEKKERKERGSRSRTRSRSRSRSRGSVDALNVAGSVLGIDGAVDHLRRRHHHHHAERKRGSPARSGGFFSWPWLGRHRSGFFGFNQPSYYRRTSRHGFVQRALRKAKHLLQTLARYAQHHPLKVFSLVLVPLLTTGALAALLARFGLRLPPALTRLLGVAGRVASGDSLGLVGDAVRFARTSSTVEFDGPGASTGAGLGSLSSLWSVASRFV